MTRIDDADETYLADKRAEAASQLNPNTYAVALLYITKDPTKVLLPGSDALRESAIKAVMLSAPSKQLLMQRARVAVHKYSNGAQTGKVGEVEDAIRAAWAMGYGAGVAIDQYGLTKTQAEARLDFINNGGHFPNLIGDAPLSILFTPPTPTKPARRRSRSKGGTA